jgi:hypothetical protein
MSLKIFSVVESVDSVISNINTFISHPTNIADVNNDENTKKEAEQLFIELIHEHTHPVTLDDKSKKYWLDKKIYTNHNYRLQIVSGYSKN